MQGNYKLIPLLGVNTEPLDDQSPDGLCHEIVNLKPKGYDQNPYWVPFEKILRLCNDQETEFTYQHGIEHIKGAFWQIRNQIGDYSDTGNTSLRRLVVLCDGPARKALDIIDPADWSIVKTQTLPGTGNYRISCTRIGEITPISVVRDNIPLILYYLLDDMFVPQGWPKLPEVRFTLPQKYYTQEHIIAGTTAGVLRKEYNQYFLVRWAFRTFEGSYVKHSAPLLAMVSLGSPLTSGVPRFELLGYDEDIMETQPYWKELISGLSVFATQPRLDKQEALDDGTYYELGHWNFFDRRPEELWTSEINPNIIETPHDSSVWPALRVLNIDNFTHHRLSGNVIDTYNSRLLLGGVGLDFGIPDLRKPFSSGNTEETSMSYYIKEPHLNNYNYSVRYYSASGAETSPGNEYYRIETRDVQARYRPVDGREFKTVIIREFNFPGTSDRQTTPDGQFLPNFIGSVKINLTPQNELELNYKYVSSTRHGNQSHDPYYRIELEIGPVDGPADEMVSAYVRRGSDTTAPFYFTGVTVSGDGPQDNLPEAYYEVTIKTDNGTYKRIASEPLAHNANAVFLPELLSYPDRRAIKYRIWVRYEGVYELALDLDLVQHPNSNYAYSYLDNGKNIYVLGSSNVTTTDPPDFSVNLEKSFLRNRIQASQANHSFIFDAATSYRIGSRENDTVQGFAVNSIDISSGQFGQYPLFVLSDKSIWALEQAPDPTIAFGRIVPVDTFNGLQNPGALCNAERVIIAGDKNYIYAISGQSIDRIDRPISHHPDYKQFLDGLITAYHKAGDYEEVIFSNPAFSYSWVYNLRYGVWYMASESYRLFFQNQPNIFAITRENAVKDYSRKDTGTPVAWSLATRPWNFGNKYLLKRLWKSQLRARFSQPHLEDPAAYVPVQLKLEGWKESHEHPFPLLEYGQRQETVRDMWITSKYGVMNAYSVKMSGSNTHEGSYIHQFEMDHENRYATRIRR